jgi:hypothetical protein
MRTAPQAPQSPVQPSNQEEVDKVLAAIDWAVLARFMADRRALLERQYEVWCRAAARAPSAEEGEVELAVMVGIGERIARLP